jgi:hypothetical protein
MDTKEKIGAIVAVGGLLIAAIKSGASVISWWRERPRLTAQASFFGGADGSGFNIHITNLSTKPAVISWWKHDGGWGVVTRQGADNRAFGILREPLSRSWIHQAAIKQSGIIRH